MKILAARRLKASSNADEAKARNFIKEIANIEPGKVLVSIPGIIRFEIRPDQYSAACRALNDRYGIGERAGPGITAGILTWKITPTRGVTVSNSKYGGSGYSIVLFDADHRETSQQMLRRILGDPKPVVKR